MSRRSDDLRQKRAKVYADARAVLDGADKRDAGKQALTADEDRHTPNTLPKRSD